MKAKDMIGRFHRRIVVTAVLMGVLIGTIAVTAPGAALEADNGSTSANPQAPGANATYRITTVAEPGDATVRVGMKRITLNYGADSDFSGSLTGVTARDVDVTIQNGGEERSIGVDKISTNPRGSWATIDLRRTYDIEPDDQIVVKVSDVTSSEIAIENPRGTRGFVVGVRALTGRGQGDGPVQVRYGLDPNASSTTPAADGTMSETNTTEGTPASASSEESTTAKSTDSTTTPSANGGSENETTSATGPGFGVVATVVALLAVALLATKRR